MFSPRPRLCPVFRHMTLRKNNLVTAASPSAGSRGISLSSASPLANSLAFSSPSSREARSPVSSAQMTLSERDELSTSSRLNDLEERARNVRRNMTVVDCQRDQTLVELAGVKKELGRVMAELKGFHVREAGRMGDMLALKQSNKKLQEEVKRLDAVALDLENELSAAEIKLEKYQSGELQSTKVLEHTRALEERLGERETDVEAREWRIDDLMHQVSVLKDCVLEYQGKMIDAERTNEGLSKALQETEQSYYSVVQSSMASLQSMDTRLSELKKEVLSKEGSNSARPADETGASGRRTEGKAEDLQAITPESMGYSANGRTGHMDKARNALHASRESIKYLESLNALEALEGRLKDVELAHAETLTRCQELATENACLREEMANMERRQSFKDIEYQKSKEETRTELASALERIEDEAATKVDQAVEALSVEHEREVRRLEAGHMDAMSTMERSKDAEITRLREEARSLGLALESSKAAEGRAKAENKKLVREKEVLCTVIEELKLTLEKQVGGAAAGAGAANNVNKENSTAVNVMAKSKSGKDVLHESIRGTPLRSLRNTNI
jgi:hypothetical protein